MQPLSGKDTSILSSSLSLMDPHDRSQHRDPAQNSADLPPHVGLGALADIVADLQHFFDTTLREIMR